MKQNLLDTIEFYAESSPAAVLADQGERARYALEQLNATPEDRLDDPDEPDRLTALLDAVADVVEQFGADPRTDATAACVNAMQRCAQEWAD